MSWGWMTYYHNVASGLISEREKKRKRGRNVYQRGYRWAGTAFLMIDDDDDDDLFALAGWLVGWIGLGWFRGDVSVFFIFLLPALDE